MQCTLQKMATYHSAPLRTHHSTAVVGDFLYLWGGQGTQNPNIIETFNVKTLKWQHKSTAGKPPSGKLRYACTALGENIYYFGGNCKPSECFHNSLVELNTEILQWRELIPDNNSLPGNPLKKHGCGMVHFIDDENDYLLLIGGVGLAPESVVDNRSYSSVPTNSKFVHTNEVHTAFLADSSAAQCSWSVPAVSGALPPPCAYFTLECIGENRFLLFGGIESELGQTNNVYLLTMRKQTLHVEKIHVPSRGRIDWPRRRISHASTSFNVGHSCSEFTTHLLVLGGLDTDFETISDCWILNCDKMTWNKVVLPDCVSERFDHSVSAFFVSGQCVWVVAIGGLIELDSTRKLKPANELAAMFELVYSDGRWTIGTVTVNLDELKLIQAHRRERMLLDRLLEGRKMFQQKMVKGKPKPDEAFIHNKKESDRTKHNCHELATKPHWVLDKEEITLTSESLGGGAYGKVMVAEFRGMKVAAKQIHEILISEYSIRLFTREMDIISKVTHPNIVQFLGATRVENPILLFELMTTSLSNVLKNGPIPHTQAISIAIQISYALAYLHLYKPTAIVHRDVSSPNVLLEHCTSDKWKAKLSDFGSANLLSHVQTTIPGNLSYSAPEAERAVNQTPAMDVYSLGIVILEMILHELPCRTEFERLEQAKRIDWLEVQAMILKCITSDYCHRPSTLALISMLKELST